MYFVTLCCGILTLKTSDSFFRSFCFLRQNGAFSATEQNQIYKNSLFFRNFNAVRFLFFLRWKSWFHLVPKNRKAEIIYRIQCDVGASKNAGQAFSTPRLSSHCILYIISAFCLFSFLNQDESSKAIFFI